LVEDGFEGVGVVVKGYENDRDSVPWMGGNHCSRLQYRVGAEYKWTKMDLSRYSPAQNFN